jgi:antitoxin component HigA of HigAB toxin-antitoxin module
MYLITKNKIADYIEQHPEAQTAFLTWIKEFPYWESNNNENQPIVGVLNGWFGLGGGDYWIEFKFNPWLKTGYMLWIGTEKARIEYENAKIEKLRIKHPDLVTTSVTITTPASARRSKKESEDSVRQDKAPEIFPSPIEGYVASEFDLKTQTEYENALNKAIALFDAQPGTPEFDELALLLPFIRHHEATNIELPRLALLDVIKLKMEMLEMNPSHLTFIIGSDEEVNLFLTGKNTLPDKTLKTVCKLLCIRIPLNDKSLIK